MQVALKVALVAIVWFGFVSGVHAQIFKCKQGATTVFSATPCGGTVETVELRAPANIGSVAPVVEEKPSGEVVDAAATQVVPAAPPAPSACTDIGSTELRRRIIEQKVFVGMKQADVVRSWGKPASVNRSSYGDDQWVYDRGGSAQYVYIGSEGCVTAWN